MIGLRRPVCTRHVEQCGEAGPRPRPHHGQALLHEGAIEAAQRHHVGHGRQRHEIERREQIGCRPARREEGRAAQMAHEGDEHDEDDAGRAEMAEAGEIVEPVWVDDDGVRQRFGRLMVIDDDDVEAEAARVLHGGVARRAAIDGDEEARAGGLQRLDRRHVRPVTLRQPIGNVDAVRRAARRQQSREQRGRSGAVDVVVAEDGDGLAPRDRRAEARHGFIHVLEGRRIRQQVAHRRREKGWRVVEAGAARRDDARQEIGQVVALRHGARTRRARFVQPVVPGPAEHRALDPQDEPARAHLRLSVAP